MDGTHEPTLRSWVETANAAGADFPIQNLPFGVFRERGRHEAPRIGIAIGDRILDLVRARQAGLLKGLSAAALDAIAEPTLNRVMALGRAEASAIRAYASRILTAGSGAAGDNVLVPMADAMLELPATIGDYTDFYASLFHATNVGQMFRPGRPLLPNYKHLPIGYHGRASSIVTGGTPIKRPSGQANASDQDIPRFGLSERLDYELEIAAFVGAGNTLGDPIPIEVAEDHLFGLCLLNDWSARDLQAWEYQPLGPFLSKSFATTISPWVVTLDALEPFRCAAFSRPASDPPLLPYLTSQENASTGGFDIVAEVWLRSARMREHRLEAVRVSRGRFRDMYWTFAQMVAHHTAAGCNLRPGDLLGSGTISGPDDGSRGCLLEITQQGKKPVQLPGGESRGFLADGDEVLMRAYCERTGFVRIGFGACSGTVVGRAL